MADDSYDELGQYNFCHSDIPITGSDVNLNNSPKRNAGEFKQLQVLKKSKWP